MTSTSTATRIRLILAPLVLICFVLPSLCQPLLDHLWSYLLHTSLYNWSTFETIWTVFCYAAVEVSITVVFMRNPSWRFLPPGTGRKDDRSKPRGMRRPSRRLLEGATYVGPLLALDLTMVKKFADVPVESIVLSGGYYLPPSLPDVLNNASSPSHHLPPRTFLIPTVHNFTLASPLQLIRALPDSAPSSRRLVTELATSFLIYDFLFFLFHLSLHQITPLRRWHAPHHSHDQQINPQVTNQLSVIERLGLVLLANFSLNIIGSHVLTRTAFVPVFVWLLVEIHCGMDVPWGYEKLLPRGWGHGARGHWRHHRGLEGGYEPFFGWWDGAWEVWCGGGKGKGHDGAVSRVKVA